MLTVVSQVPNLSAIWLLSRPVTTSSSTLCSRWANKSYRPRSSAISAHCLRLALSLCFDRIVINGYLSGLSRPEQVVHFFRQIIGVPIVSKEVLSQRTNDYQNWVEAFARNHNLLIEWAQRYMGYGRHFFGGDQGYNRIRSTSLSVISSFVRL
jgi:hypothetical protein